MTAPGLPCWLSYEVWFSLTSGGCCAFVEVNGSAIRLTHYRYVFTDFFCASTVCNYFIIKTPKFPLFVHFNATVAPQLKVVILRHPYKPDCVIADNLPNLPMSLLQKETQVKKRTSKKRLFGTFVVAFSVVTASCLQHSRIPVPIRLGHPSPDQSHSHSPAHASGPCSVRPQPQSEPLRSRIRCWQLRVTAVQAQGGTHSWMMQHSPPVLQLSC